ncbi:MAG: chromosomal replication initiator protein DnaA [Gemmatimonadetes bacterium]|nr:chromosomal replication initiator protein DnaA [Gemmatimonadota bacterium]
MELTVAEVWSRVLESARANLPEQSFQTWLAGTSAVAITSDTLLVEAPSQFHVEWIEDKYAVLLGELSERLFGRRLTMAFQARSEPQASAGSPPPLMVTAPASRRPVASERSSSYSRSPGLNERYSFERFVVGTSNQLAAAACHAVAEQPARIYNPLFVYGGVGLGKTHLMHAIGNVILHLDPSKRVMYVSTEQFTNELVTAIQEGTTPDFRRRYRQMDLLLVDDVHFLEGKERTQEEFFHTFNALYDAHKQIVLTSDRPPKEIAELEDRLVSRFEWGLVTDIKPPDFETRIAILRKKAEDDGLVLDDEVIDYIARSCTSSVRELEGAVIKLLAYSSLTNQEITLALARTALRGMIPGAGYAEEALTADRIREAVARRWNVTSAALISQRRTKDLTVPRQIAMYLIKQLLNLPLTDIGHQFGGRDHSTVIHSIRKVEELTKTDLEYRTKVDELREELRRLL